jgi:UDP-glucose 4-epimerase
VKTVLVTGGAGFIGSHVTEELLARGCRVVVLDDLSGGFKENLPSHPDLTFMEESITNRVFVRYLFSKFYFHSVFHFAAYAAEGLSHFIRKYNYENNLIGSINLINAAVKSECKNFVFSSSIAVYGNTPSPMSEEDTPQPEDPYGIAKFAVEMDLKAAHKMFGLNYIIFRLHNVYGERQNIGDPYRNVIGIFMNNILRGKPCPIFGDGSQRRAFTYIKDISRIMARSMDMPEAGNQIFNLGADAHTSVKDLLVFVQKAMHRDTGAEFLPARKEAFYAYSQHRKMKAVLAPLFVETPLSIGLTHMAEWVKKSGARSTKPFTDIEITENLPPSWKGIMA